jgi:hypothetical protein
MWQNLIGKVLPGLQDAIAKKLLGDLTKAGKKIAVDEVAKQVSRITLKGIDSFLAVAVKNLPSDQASTLADAYTTALADQIDQFGEAIDAYLPLQLAVEVAKKQHGDKSPEANAARAARVAGIAEMRQEVRDVFRTVTGGTVAD